MLPESVEYDSDLPEILDTAAKQEERAKQLAAAHLGKKAESVQAPGIQGFFSRTRFVDMEEGGRVVIQFRIQPLDIECFKKARRVFDVVVPVISQLHDEELESLGMTVYAMSYVPGRCWMQIGGLRIEQRISIAESLGAILGLGFVADQSANVVENFILPCLKRFRDSISESTEALRAHVERLITATPGLNKLPLYFSHHDLNEMNVLINEDDHTISGLVDWECAKDLPFGMGLHRITDTIVANNVRGTIAIPKGSEAAENAFWSAVLSNAPPIVLENLEDVQTALHIGSLIFAFTEKHTESPRSVGFLAGVLTYRIPQLRGDADPFAPEYMSQ